MPLFLFMTTYIKKKILDMRSFARIYLQQFFPKMSSLRRRIYKLCFY